jgi:hypothetical protein
MSVPLVRDNITIRLSPILASHALNVSSISLSW